MDGRHPLQRVVLVHGYGADIHSHWFDWLARTAPGVERVRLPRPDAPRASTWVPLVREAIGSLDERTAVVTHSLGGIAALRALADLARDGGRLGDLVLVAPFAQALPPTGDVGLDSFVTHALPAFVDGYDPATVRGSARRTTVIRSDDDPIVPAEASEAVARDLGAHRVVLPDAGHLLAEDGVTTLEPVTRALGL